MRDLIELWVERGGTSLKEESFRGPRFENAEAGKHVEGDNEEGRRKGKREILCTNEGKTKTN